MLHKRDFLGWLSSRNALVLLTLLAAVPVLAAEEPTRAAARPLATLHITPGTVSWEAPAGLGELELDVAGPDGVVVRRQFAASETPTFDLFDERGERRPDGVYTYEVRSARELRPGRSLLLSGSLAIRDGSFVDPEALDERPSKGLRPIFEADTVIPDDLIVNGNTCLGFECVDGTPGIPLHMKHSSPRILFEDTGGGVSGTHDWEILINGAFGEESFKIFDDDSQTVPFTLTGSAPSHSLFVSSAGNVGLGTSTPAVRLDVKGSASGATERLQNSSATGYSGIEYLNNAGNVSLYIGTDNASSNTRFNSINNYPIVILTESTERMRVTSAGSVGIGTSTPSSKFHVSGGDIRVSGGSFIDDGVTLNAPDYVFEPSYKLMPLSELREFVTQEKHLPNVPKAKEVKEQGLNLSQFQMRLLEKVEELTLYTLAQDERFTTQQEEVRLLKEQNAALLQRLAALEQALSSEEKP